MKKVRVFTLVCIIILAVLGGVGIKYIIDYVSQQEDNIISEKFNQRSSLIINKLNSNITAFGNYLASANLGIEQLYLDGLSPNMSLNQFQRIAGEPDDVIKFNTTRIIYSRIINDSNELNIFLAIASKLYNKTNIQPYENLNGTATRLPNNFTYPLLLELIAHPFGSVPGLPKFGVLNVLTVNGFNTTELRKSIEFPNRQISVSNVNIVTRVDGIIEKNFLFSTLIKPWYVFSSLDPDNFLSTILSDNDDEFINIKIMDEKTTLFETANQNDLSNRIIIHKIKFPFRDWTIIITATNSFSDNNKTTSKVFILAVAISLVVITLLGIALIGEFGVYQTRVTEAKNEMTQKTESIHQSNRIVLHEIRNLTNIIFGIFNIRKNKQLINNDFDVVKNTICSILKLTTNIIDFEQLLFNKYTPKQDNIDIIHLINDIIQQCNIVNIELNYPDFNTIIIGDCDKLQELILNGLSNATKHTEDRFIKIKIQPINDGLLLCEITNHVNTLPTVDFESCFIPFFMKGEDSRHIWGYTIDTLLTLNKDMYEKASKYIFNDEPLFNTTRYVSTQDAELYIHKKSSSGLGLAISRLIAKALGGECGVEYDKSKLTVKFWFVVKYKNPIMDISL